MNKLSHLFDSNLAWANEVKNKNPDFFSELSKQQAPEYLWIGCSDSRVPANQIVRLPPGAVFVHRNIANVVVHTDLNCLSVIQYAVDVLKVKHIVVCGHYGCGGIKASLERNEHGLIDNWLRHVKDVSRFNADKLEGLSNEDKVNRLCELNVIEQVRNVCNTTIVKKAWRAGAELTIHGWVYSIENGILKDLDTCISSLPETEEWNRNIYHRFD
ncbi:MAG: carbonate dehydratase [Gammaproteobacteria bacterium]|nr:carbonate dehydratase [Gammaproteobacteria bacterium]